ncbi:hypothetical protein [Sphingomonas sp. LC-1]|uniref:hypothetical protein n=1 Tax=Sphingomonas sp. LC-1 TaxID=3110957 RepID=UPI0021BB1A6E|nr:hypothetical protein [Sphingomonas sp. LC-1]
MKAENKHNATEMVDFLHPVGMYRLRVEARLSHSGVLPCSPAIIRHNFALSASEWTCTFG